jgi:hypothetical protein
MPRKRLWDAFAVAIARCRTERKCLVLVGQELEAHRIETFVDHVKLLGCPQGEIDLPAWTEGATVVDGDDDGAAVAQVGDLDPGAKGKGAVGGGHGVHVEWVAAGGETPLEHGAIPTGKATLDPGEDGGAGPGTGGSGEGGDDLVRGDVVNHRGVRRSRGCRSVVCRKSRHDDQGRYSKSGLVPSWQGCSTFVSK